MAELIAVAALDLSHVAWLWALLEQLSVQAWSKRWLMVLMTYLRDVTLLVAVAAHDDALVLAGLGRVTLLVAVTADLVRAVAREVAHLAALLALDVAEIAWLIAVLRDVALRAACTRLALTSKIFGG